jgi:hypothetical protein
MGKRYRVKVSGRKWSLARAVSQYDATDAIWKDPRNADLELVAEFHKRLANSTDCYQVFWGNLKTIDRRSDFISHLVLAVRGLSNPLTLQMTLTNEAMNWSRTNHFQWKDGFGPTHDLLLTTEYRTVREDLDAALAGRYRAQILVKTRAV